MRSLTLSLIATVILSTIGLGFFLSWIYAAINPSHVESHDLNIYKSLTAKLSNLIATDKAYRDFIDLWNDSHDFKIELLDQDAIVFPPKIHQEFMQGDTVALESEHGVSYYHFVPKISKLLSLTSPTIAAPEQNHIQVIFTGIFYLGVIICLSFWLIPLLTRLKQIDEVSRKFGEGHLSSRIAIGSISYTKNIETTFNLMAERIQDLISDNKLLGRAVSHDLKTPLARLRFGIETLKEESTPSKQGEYIDRISCDIDLMEDLVNALLDYAKLDSSQLKLNMNPINLTRFIESEFKLLHNVSPIELNTELPHANLTILADQFYLRMLLNNLIDNAMQYAQNALLVSTEISAEHVLLHIEDDGKGIKASEVNDIFKPFKRGTSTREHSTPANGHGMGLAICDRITRWFGAEIAASKSPSLGGAKFTVKFPRLPDDHS